ncbi:MAG TPA: carboxypeptidase regulatory-like domain-containing protein [Pyrinomonadaceae bacterium]|nr:carboxypeptidase regulatory-like domain-containing protein [Pyrinomonadaceae bacterium]
MNKDQHQIVTRIIFPFLVTIFFTTGLAVGFSQGGIIRGKVVADIPDQRKTLPGVVVILSGERLAGKKLQTVSDAEGQYDFPGLIAGDYIVTVEFSGFKKYEQRLGVQIEATVEHDILLQPVPLSESVTVTDDRTDASKTESTTPSVITNEALRDAPLIDQKFQDALPLLPGVVRGPDGNLNIKGTHPSQSGILVSSLNVTDPVTGAPAIELPLEAVDTVQVHSNPYSSEFGKFTGAVTTIETRSGSNNWRYLMTGVLPRPRWRDGKLFGVGAATPRIAVGGPIKKDKLFFFQSVEYRFVRTNVPSLETLEERQRDIQRESFDSFSRVDYVVNSNNRLTASFSLFPQKFDYFNLNTFNPSDTTANFHQRGWFLAFNEQATFNSGALLQSSFSAKQFDGDIFGNSEAPYELTPERNFGGWFNRQHRESRRYELLEVFHFAPRTWRGSHSFKTGVNFSHTSFTGTDRSNPVTILRANGLCPESTQIGSQDLRANIFLAQRPKGAKKTLSDPIALCAFAPLRESSSLKEVLFVQSRGNGTTHQLLEFVGAGVLDRQQNEFSAFVQDKWILNRRVVFDLGLRYDSDTIGKNNNLAPRVGFVVTPADSDRTVVRGGVGLFYDKIPLNVGSFEQYQSLLVTTFANDGVTPVDGPRLFPNTAPEDLENPYSVAWNLQLDHQLNPRLLLRLGYEERSTRRDFVIEPTPTALLLQNNGRSRYRELQGVARFRFQEGRNIYLSYVRSQARGNLNDFNTYFGNLKHAVIRPDEYGKQPFDVPNRLLFWGDFALPYDVVATPVVDWRSGFPFSLLNEEQDFVGPRNEGGRFPRLLSFDLLVTKGLTIRFRGKQYKGRAGFTIFNITNHWNPRDVQNNIAAQRFGTFYNSPDRSVRLKFEFVKY